jgi:hypothetical protein
MRRPMLLIGLATTGLLCGCGGSPQALGITGPGPAPSPPGAQDDSVSPTPGFPSMNSGSSPVQRFFNYND